MDILTLKFSDAHKDTTNAEKSKLLDEEVEKFSAYMTSIDDYKAAGPLFHLERALLKTYLIYKIKGDANGSR